jgi:xylose dehydrogenase (NAD/NADP)
MVSSAPLRIGILGAANIARQFTSGVAPSKRVAVTAVASRDLAKAEKFARECGIERALGSYEALLADPQIDAIYNPPRTPDRCVQRRSVTMFILRRRIRISRNRNR